MIRTKGEAGSGDIVEAVRHMRKVQSQMRWVQTLRPDELYHAAKELQAPLPLVAEVARTGSIPVVNFAAGGVAIPADAALMMQLGADGVFVGSGIFKSENPAARAKAVVEATTHFQDPEVLARVSKGLGESMRGRQVSDLPEAERLAQRGW